jgi:hypothetical protein
MKPPTSGRAVHYLPTFRERSMKSWNQNAKMCALVREIIQDVQRIRPRAQAIRLRSLVCASHRSKVGAPLKWRI